jgi:hypothetical protein
VGGGLLLGLPLTARLGVALCFFFVFCFDAGWALDARPAGPMIALVLFDVFFFFFFLSAVVPGAVRAGLVFFSSIGQLLRLLSTPCFVRFARVRLLLRFRRSSRRCALIAKLMH